MQTLDRRWVMQLQCGGAILICPSIAAIATPLQTSGGPALLSLLRQKDPSKTCGALFLGKLGLETWTDTVLRPTAQTREPQGKAEQLTGRRGLQGALDHLLI